MKNNSKYSILLIGSTPPPNHGVCIQNKILLDSKLKDEFNLIHIPNSYKKNIQSVGTFNILGILTAIKSYFILFQYLLKLKKCIVYLTLAQNNIGFIRDSFYILIGKIFKNTKVLIHCRGSMYYKHYINLKKILQKYFDYVYSKTDYCIVLGDKLKDMMNKWFPPNNTFVIPNGTNFTNRFNNQEKKVSPLVLGYIGIISEQKGIFDLLHSFIYIKKKFNDVKLNIAGSFVNTYTENKVRNIINENDLNDSIKFVGIVDGTEKEKFYNSINILLMPSWHEGHPNVILEALASKLPVIASDVGAISESVIEDYNGFLVPPQNIELLSAKIEKIISNIELLKTMSENSYKLYLEKFTEEIYINKMIKAFYKIIKNETI